MKEKINGNEKKQGKEEGKERKKENLSVQEIRKKKKKRKY